MMHNMARHNTHGRIRRGGFTLIEAIVAIVILAAAVPTTVIVLGDASSARAQALSASRATWLATGVLEQIIFDANSPAADLGMAALDDPDSYLNTPTTGLIARMGPVTDLFDSLGMSYQVSIGPLVGPQGIATGTPAEDVYRYVQVRVDWNSPRGGAQQLAIGALVTDVDA